MTSPSECASTWQTCESSICKDSTATTGRRDLTIDRLFSDDFLAQMDGSFTRCHRMMSLTGVLTLLLGQAPARTFCTAIACGSASSPAPVRWAARRTDDFRKIMPLRDPAFLPDATLAFSPRFSRD